MRALREGCLNWNGHSTWYVVFGDLASDRHGIPVVVCHGGPGFAHDYCEPMAEMISVSGRPCVLYDQIGCGRSQHLPDMPSEFWSIDLFKRELVALLRHLGIHGSHVVLGQSWGGWLALEYALDAPRGLQGLILANTPASAPLLISEVERLRAALPDEIQETLSRHEATGTTDSHEYEEAARAFYDRHLCRVPWPACVERSMSQFAGDPAVYHAMWGPAEFHPLGSLKTWDITDRIQEIDRPCLLLSGRYDEATPLTVEALHTRLPHSEWVLFEQSSHMPHIEEPMAFKEAVEGFLGSLDA